MKIIQNPAREKKGNVQEKQSITLLEIYREFRSRKFGIKVNADDYQDICKVFMNLVHDAMIYEGFELNPHCNIGKFSIRKRKTKLTKLKVDFHNTKKVREETGNEKLVVYHMNNHSSGWYYYHHWKKGNTTGVMMWSFTPIKQHRGKIAEAVKAKTIKPFIPLLKVNS